MIKFNLEEWTQEFYEEISPLLQKHYKEVAHYQDIPLEPDFDRYLLLQQRELLYVFTARKEDHTIVGYALFVLDYNLHYKNSLQAHQDVIFVDPEQRGFGSKFIQWCDEQLVKLGAQAVYHHVKAEHNFGKILERQGYELVDLIYAKRLDKGE